MGVLNDLEFMEGLLNGVLGLPRLEQLPVAWEHHHAPVDETGQLLVVMERVVLLVIARKALVLAMQAQGLHAMVRNDGAVLAILQVFPRHPSCQLSWTIARPPILLSCCVGAVVQVDEDHCRARGSGCY